MYLGDKSVIDLVLILILILMQVRLGCFLEIPQSAIPSHPLLGFVYSSLQVVIASYIILGSFLEVNFFSSSFAFLRKHDCR